MNPIQATIDGNRVAILGRFLAFGSRHVAQGTTVHLTKDGNDYIGVGRSAWEWTIDQNGNKVSDNGSNFRLSPPQLPGQDVALFNPCDPNRGFPDESIEPVASVKVGDKVFVTLKNGGLRLPAKVTGIIEQAFMISIDATIAGGQSGSLVTDANDVFVGFVSTPQGVSVPNLGSTVGTTPSTPPPQPTPTPAPAPTRAAVDEAKAKIQAILETL